MEIETEMEKETYHYVIVKNQKLNLTSKLTLNLKIQCEEYGYHEKLTVTQYIVSQNTRTSFCRLVDEDPHFLSQSLITSLTALNCKSNYKCSNLLSNCIW